MAQALPFFILTISAFGLTVLLTPLLSRIALRLGWVDRPDNYRKLHKRPIPRIGGIPIVLAYVGAFGVLLLMRPQFAGIRDDALLEALRVLPAFAVVFGVGLLDDIVGLEPWTKLLGQIVAAELACLGGIQISGIAYFPIPPYLGIPLTILWLVGCTNAFNLIDGVDGLAAGLGLLATLTTLAAALFHGDAGLVIATAPLAGALLAFLRFNFNPASVFLGDSGSLSVGFMLGCCAVIWSQKAITILAMTAPLMALSIPLLDMSLAIARRYLLRRPIFGADRSHIHHRLLDRGLTPRRVVLLLYAASAAGACCSLLQSTLKDAGVPVTLIFCVVVWGGIQFLRYSEFGVVARLLRHNNIRNLVRCENAMHEYKQAVRAARNIEECWQALRTLGGEFDCASIALGWKGVFYEEELGSIDHRHWVLRVPLSDFGYVEFLCNSAASRMSLEIGILSTLLSDTLLPKLKEVRASGTRTPRRMRIASAELIGTL